VGISGFSMGGGIASWCGALDTSGGDLAIVPCMGADKAVPLVQGILKHQCDWEALMLHPERGNLGTVAQVQQASFEFVCRGDLSKYTDKIPADAIGNRVLVQVQGTEDAFVDPAGGLELFDLVSPTCKHAEVHWTNTGHVAGFLMTPWLFVPAICRAFDLLEADQKKEKKSSTA
jgi:hypothetical protein